MAKVMCFGRLSPSTRRRPASWNLSSLSSSGLVRIQGAGREKSQTQGGEKEAEQNRDVAGGYHASGPPRKRPAVMRSTPPGAHAASSCQSRLGAARRCGEEEPAMKFYNDGGGPGHHRPRSAR